MWRLINLSLILLTSLLLLVLQSSSYGYVVNPVTGKLSKIDAVMLTTGKDTRVFVKSIDSALIHLIDVDKFYIVSPHINDLKKNPELEETLKNPRVVLIEESKFPFNGGNVSEIMIEAVREKEKYPLNGNSHFEKTVWGRIGWFLQQLLKFYAGKVCGLKDFVLLDSDLMWFTDILFISNKTQAEILNNTTYPSPKKGAPPRLDWPVYNGNAYLYASSNQYHPAYLAILSRISGVPLVDDGKVFRSGIVHHIVIVESILDDLMKRSEEKHGIPFWQILLNQSALEMTCRAPHPAICGAGSTLSEYELYFNFARHEYPGSVELRQPALLWANGPAPGLQFWPHSETELISDGYKSSWVGHRQNEIPKALTAQINADRAQGYDYVGYHAYAKRRYYEIVGEDLTLRCNNVPEPFNTTCSWKGYEDNPISQNRTMEDWFKGCGCYMALHASGP